MSNTTIASNNTNYSTTFSYYDDPITGVISTTKPEEHTKTMSQQPRTQKGKGIVALQSMLNARPIKALFAHEVEAIPTLGFPWFARPAPSEPRHGYLDSRVVQTREEAVALLAEVLKDDPKGELIFCSFLEAQHNAILTPTSLVVGKGHDGATAGKDCAVVPLVELKVCTNTVKNLAAIKDSDWPYIELVQGELHSTPVFVQLRGGPKMSSVLGDYIPKVTQVTNVLKADPSVYQDLGWEEAIENALPGTIVWHPGGAMTDHFAIHAFLHKIPIVFSPKPPKVGSVLEPTDTEGMGEYDPGAMLKGVMAGERFQIDNPSGIGTPAISVILLALHNATVMTGEASRWLGFASALMIRFGTIALRGEARHIGLNDGMERGKVYAKYVQKSLRYQRASLNRLINVFRYGKWGSVAFGGPKWACCGASIAGLLNAIQILAQEQTPGAAAGLAKALNLAVNQAHNGGWWLNKFSNAAIFTEIPKGNVGYIAQTMGVFGAAHQVYQGLSEAFVQRKIAQYGAWPVTTLAPPHTRAATVAFHPGIGSLKIDVSAKLLEGKNKSINVNLPVTLLPAQLEAMKTQTYLVEGKDGYRIEIRPLDGAPLVIWEEESLMKMAQAQSTAVKGE